jgi:hypothetical protein
MRIRRLENVGHLTAATNLASPIQSWPCGSSTIRAQSSCRRRADVKTPHTFVPSRQTPVRRRKDGR